MYKKNTDILFSRDIQDKLGIIEQGVVQETHQWDNGLVYMCKGWDKRDPSIEISPIYVKEKDITINHHVAPIVKDTPTQGVDAILSERGARYGDFGGHARITQRIKRVMAESDKWNHLSWAQQEALEMIAHKLGRILNGDPNYKDSWTDIIGYARLVEETL